MGKSHRKLPFIRLPIGNLFCYGYWCCCCSEVLLLLLQINSPFFVTPSRIIGWSEQHKSLKMLNARADSELRHSVVFRTIFEIMIGWLRPGLEKYGSNPKF